MKKIKLEIIALSSSVRQTQSYAVVLGEKDGLRRLPIVIGAFEAQAIVVSLEKIKPSRPLTHDLFYNFLNTFKIELKEVLIHRLEEGIFYAKLICVFKDEIIELDSRTSDSLALAVRAKCPIFTFDHILDSAGLVIDFSDISNVEEGTEDIVKKKGDIQKDEPEDLKSMSLTALNTLLDKVLEKEDYAKAITIRDEINRREEEK